MDEKQYEILQGRVDKLTEDLATSKAEHEANIATIKAEHQSIIAEKDREIAALTEKVQAAEHEATKNQVETLVDNSVKAGRVLPKDRDALVNEGLALRSLANHAAEDSPFSTFAARLTKGRKIIEFDEKSETGDLDETDDRSEWDREYDAGVETGEKIKAKAKA